MGVESYPWGLSILDHGYKYGPIKMHLVTHGIGYFVYVLLLFSSVVSGDETNRDIVLLLDKGIDLRSINNEIGTVFEQLEKSENNTRIAIIGFDLVVTDVASLSLASEGGGKVLLEALTHEGGPSSSANVAAGIERGISELTSPEAEAFSKAIIVFSDGVIQTGSEQSDQDYRSWLADVLTPSAVRSKIRIFWVSTGSAASEELIQKVTQATGGKQYLINTVTEGEFVKDVLAAASPVSDNAVTAKSSHSDNVSVSDIPETIDNTSKPESDSLNVEKVAKAPLQGSDLVESTETNTALLEENAEEQEQKTLAIAKESVSEKIPQESTSFPISIKEGFTRVVKASKYFISTQADKQAWLMVFMGLLILMVAGILIIRIFANNKNERVEPVISDKASQAAASLVGDTEELFIDAVMQKAESAKDDSMDSRHNATRKANIRTSIPEEKGAWPDQPPREGMKAPDQSSSNDRTAIRPVE